MGKPIFIKDDSLDIAIVEPPIPKPQQMAMLSLYPRNLIKLLGEDYDVVHAFKLLPHTAPVASCAKRLRDKKFVLSIDDYDAAASNNPFKRVVMKWAERSYKNADAITASSVQLQKIYGGDVLYHVPNEKLFLKTNITREGIKKKLGIEGKTMVLYAGTFYNHKGIDVLIRAVQKLKRNDIALVLAGYGNTEEELRKIAGPETIFLGRVDMKRVAELTVACDIYAIPTKDTAYARSEIPGKIFEPMMLGKPIIASRISDIPRILDNGRSGLLPKPDDIGSLAQAIEYLADNTKEAKRLGARARARYGEMYCMASLEKKLNSIYSGL
jgi:glycosyltransferase involved in cell wall biosynthesis